MTNTKNLDYIIFYSHTNSIKLQTLHYHCKISIDQKSNTHELFLSAVIATNRARQYKALTIFFSEFQVILKSFGVIRQVCIPQRCTHVYLRICTSCVILTHTQTVDYLHKSAGHKLVWLDNTHQDVSRNEIILFSLIKNNNLLWTLCRHLHNTKDFLHTEAQAEWTPLYPLHQQGLI